MKNDLVRQLAHKIWGAVEEIVMDGELRNIVHVELGNLLACFVYADR